MLQLSTLEFLKNLKKNNNKPWFEGHRKQYDAARADFILLIEGLINSIGKFDPPISNLKAKESIFRINRDVRFSKDKSPYKTNMAGYFNRGGKKGNGAGYYLHIQPGKSMAAGGMWMPMAPDLSKIRQEIDYNFNDWKKITGSTGFKRMFTDGVKSDSVLQRPPKGYDEDNPAIGLLKMKSFIVTRPFTDAEVLSPDFVKEVTKTFQTMKPMIDFLNRSLD